MSKSRETYKRKSTERINILSVEIIVSDIESSHCTASAEHGWFFEHPFKATRGTTPYTRFLYHLDGANVLFNKDIDKNLGQKIKEWENSSKIISTRDFVLLLIPWFGFRESQSDKRSDYKSVSAYYDIISNGKKITLRVSNHHHISYSGNSDEELSTVVLDTEEFRNFYWNQFDIFEDRKTIEYLFNSDNYTCADFSKILKGIRSFLRTLEFNWEIKPNDTKKTLRYIEYEQRKAEKKQKKGMGATKFTDISAKVDEIINLHKEKEYPLTKEEREVLRSYGGHGGENEFDRGMLDEYYTPPYVCKQMFELAKQYGYTKGKVLEPSCAIGNMIEPIYDTFEYTAIDAFEISERTKAICKLLYPKVTIYGAENQGFETAFLQPPRYTIKVKPKEVTWLKNYPYDLVIGNPPYGNFTTRYSSYFKGCQRIEMFFIEYCLKLLRKDGLLVFITQDNLLSSGFSYQIFKERILDDCEFLDAYRMPSGLFDKTEVVTDIIVLKKK